MLTFILNDTEISTDNASGGTVLDFIRYHQHLKGTKIGCREGDCGACTILVGSLSDSAVTYRAMTSCLMPLANAQGKHLVTVEGINRPDGNLTAVQHALVEENGTQCGFCTVGFVMSLTGFCLNHSARPLANVAPNEAAIAAIDGNICRCTGYKSIERAAASLSRLMQQNQEQNVLDFAIQQHIIPSYFGSIATKLAAIAANAGKDALRKDHNQTDIFVGGGTDLYVQRHEEMPHLPAKNLFDHANLQGISEKNDQIEMGGATTVTDIMESPLMHAIFPRLREHLKLVSSTPIRNMATLAGNVANASPIGDLTIWLLALNARLQLSDGTARREIALRDFYLGYKNMAKSQTEVIEKITFTRPRHTNHFNFEKVCKRTYLDIASVNTAILLEIEKGYIATAHVSAGGVSPIPLYLKNTAAFLQGKMTEKRAEWLPEAHAILQSEVSPISDVRGSAEYKRLLLRQLFQAHFAL